MKVKDLDGREHPWNLTGYVPPENSTRPRSKFHVSARELLQSMYPTDRILEEVPLPGMRLFGDFYLPLRKMMVEVHGEQHYKYTPHFHGTVQAFMKSKKNDERKKKWCQLNNISLVILPHSETEDEWRERITSR